MLYGVKEEYLHSALNAINEKYGSFEKYVKNGLLISDSEIKALRDLYLE